MEVKQHILFLFIPLFLLQPLAAAIETTSVCTSCEWTDVSADENSEAVLVAGQRLSTRTQWLLPHFLEAISLADFRKAPCCQNYKDDSLRSSDRYFRKLYCVYQE